MIHLQFFPNYTFYRSLQLPKGDRRLREVEGKAKILVIDNIE
ncbi:hypothetical protein [Nostoc sp.]